MTATDSTIWRHRWLSPIPEIGGDGDDSLFPGHRFSTLQILKQAGQGFRSCADCRSQLLLVDLGIDLVPHAVLLYQKCAQPVFDILARQLLNLIRKVSLFPQQHCDEIIPKILLPQKVQQIAP